jgi:hypothetical protein
MASIGCLFCQFVAETADALRIHSASCEKHPMMIENNTMRRIIANSEIDCVYCKLPKVDMAKCVSGFPGCARADDMML